MENEAAREAVLERLTGSDISLQQQVLSLLHAEEEARTGLLDRVRRMLSGRVSADEVDITQPLSAASDITARIDLDRRPMRQALVILRSSGNPQKLRFVLNMPVCLRPQVQRHDLEVFTSREESQRAIYNAGY